MVAAARPGGKRVGYIRVSSVDQKDLRQLDGLELDKIFRDKASGKDTQRPELQLALQYLRDGDVLVVHSMDRLARNLDDLRKLVFELTGRGVHGSVHQGVASLHARRQRDVEAVAECHGRLRGVERSLIRERQREGIALAKKVGVYKGRKKSLTTERAEELRRRVAAGEKKTALAREFGISRETLYQYAPIA